MKYCRQSERQLPLFVLHNPCWSTRQVCRPVPHRPIYLDCSAHILGFIQTWHSSNSCQLITLPPNRVRPDIGFLQIYWAVRAESAGRRSLFHSHTRKLPPSAVSPGELPVDASGHLSKQTFGRYDPPSRQLQSVLERKFRPAGHLPFQVWGLGSTSPLHVIFRRSSLAYLS